MIEAFFNSKFTPTLKREREKFYISFENYCAAQF
jgi:hypothetical protein